MISPEPNFEARFGQPSLCRAFNPMCCQSRLRHVLLSRNIDLRRPAEALSKGLKQAKLETRVSGMKRVSLALVGGFLAIAGALPASAQDVDRIDRVTGAPAPGGNFRAPEGVKVVSPGALVFASFDRNFDGRVTLEEIDAGAGLVFDVADKNKDGAVTGFEQTDWAAAMAGGGDVLANAMTFDIDLDRSVTRAEFAAGFKRLASQIQPSGDLMFVDLVQPLNRPSDQAGGGPGWGTLTPRARGTLGAPPPNGGR